MFFGEISPAWGREAPAGFMFCEGHVSQGGVKNKSWPVCNSKKASAAIIVVACSFTSKNVVDCDGWQAFSW